MIRQEFWAHRLVSRLGRVDEFEVFPTKSVGYRKTYFSLNATPHSPNQFPIS